MAKTNNFLVKASKGEIEPAPIEERVNQILKTKTPKSWIKTRPGKGGRIFSYVEHSKVTALLTGLFSPIGWSILIPEVIHLDRTVAVAKVRLEIRDKEGRLICVKEEIGTKENPRGAMSLGDLLKAAVSDGLKRCTLRLGVFLDLYSSEEEIFEEEANQEEDIDIFEILRKEVTQIYRDFNKDREVRKEDVKKLEERVKLALQNERREDKKQKYQNWLKILNHIRLSLVVK